LRGTKRIVLIVLGVVALLIVLSYVLFSLGGESPPERGRGDEIGLSRTP
jgi:hypothetical protein